MFKKHKLKGSEIPQILQTIPSPPKELFIIGDLEALLAKPRLSVVGSRKVTPYGKQVTEQLIEAVAAAGVVIISGLAIGVDGIAHNATLGVGSKTIAVLPAGLDQIYPSSHQQLAHRIVEQGGALISEYPDGTPPFKTNFIARNRLVAGLGDAVLITEAAAKSGTLHTVNFALEQGKPVLAVPGNITSPQSEGTNNLIKTGAAPVTNPRDIFEALNIEANPESQEIVAGNESEHTILLLLQEGISDGHELLERSGIPPALFNQTLTMLEITGRIKPLGNNHWSKN
jgi:DNA processing protein